ncbi:hypothetical protein ACFOPX_06540 [Helicobacter baculiformis]|uniref:Beta-lactamase n=1 Tax=Helicobacter baculiformis TaxID=427351 RepID=A0ABV7ZKE1_9HELI|nr:hypothetical protein [Helicobacter baculiformis]
MERDYGEGVLEDKTKAQQYLQKACQIWEAIAQKAFKRENYPKALEYFQKAEGKARGYYLLGNAYSGDVKSKDFSKCCSTCSFGRGV